MNYTLDALAGLRQAVADALNGRATIEMPRPRARSGAKAMGRITRREGNEEVLWRTEGWPITVAHELAVDETNASAYAEQVLNWARSVRETLDEDR